MRVPLEDVVFEDPGATHRVAAVLRTHPGPLAVACRPTAGSRSSPDTSRSTCPAPTSASASTPGAVPSPTPTCRSAIRRRSPPATGSDQGRSTRSSPGSPPNRDETGAAAGADATDELEDRIRQVREVELGDHARRVERLASWSSLVLPPDVLDSLRELIGRVRHRRTVYEAWGFDRTMSSSRGLTALFQGPPGTGKTMVAGVVARELGLDLYRVDLSK